MSSQELVVEQDPITQDHLVRIPKGDGTGFTSVNLSQIARHESRLADVSFVNPSSAPELLSALNRGCLDLNKIATQLSFEKAKAKNEHERARSRAILECNDAKLLEMGHSKGSADLRKALVEVDPEVIDTKDRLDKIDAALDLIRGKTNAFRDQHSAVRKLVSSNWIASPHYGDANRPQPFQGPNSKDIPSEYKLPKEYE
jgi:succinate dehydrogenase flavin-adding protein (antitoxin of CptAB toxin-antitoxin module)